MKYNSPTLFFIYRKTFDTNDPKNQLRCHVCGQNFKKHKLFKLHKLNYPCYMTLKELHDKDKIPYHFRCGTCGSQSNNWRYAPCNC